MAVDDLSFEVPDGQITGFLGPNGSGKSTTFRCMLGLARPTAGEVIFSGNRAGQPYRGVFADLEDKASVAGALLETTWMNRQRTARDHLRFIARGAGISDARVEECLDFVGMREAAGQRLKQFSLGMKQRVCVAQALLGDPQHFIFDEPINGLDPEGVNWVRQTLKNLAAQGRSVIVSSHLLSEMQITADRVVVIGKGRLIGQYSMDQMMAAGSVVEVESNNNQLLAQLLQQNGLAVAGDPQLLWVRPGNAGEARVRHLIASLALQHQVLVTALRVQHFDLEQQFLALTSDSQEFSTNNFAS